jgi:hypothetical protein
MAAGSNPLLLLHLVPEDARHFDEPGSTFTIETGDGMKYVGAAVIQRGCLEDGRITLTFQYLYCVRQAVLH